MATSQPFYSFHFDKFIEDQSNFEPQDGHRTIQITETESGDFNMVVTKISHGDISSWLYPKATSEATGSVRLRFLHFAPREDFRAFRPFPVSAETFSNVFSALGLPPVFLRVILSNLPMAMRFEAKCDPTNPDETKGRVGLILRTDAFSFAQYCLALVYDPLTSCTTAVCIGLRLSEFEQLMHYIEAGLRSARNYVFLPIILVDFMNHMTARWLNYNRLSLLAIANSREIKIREPGDDRGLRPDMKLDLDTATRKLTFLNDEYSITESISKTQIRFLDMIENIIIQQRKDISNNLAIAEGEDMFSDQITFLRESFKSALQYIERDRKNIEGLAQTTYCLIAQKESRNSLAIAESSRKIAEDSRKVSLWTRRDSTDMRIITVITLLFLPGTFTATLLGSNLFNFKPLDGQSIVSSWVWVYVVVTIVITLAVLCTWFFLSRSKAKEMEKKLGLMANPTLRATQPDQFEIAGFWTTRSASAIWCERIIKAEDTGGSVVSGLAKTVPTIGSEESSCHPGYGGGCGSGCGGGGCGGGCAAD